MLISVLTILPRDFDSQTPRAGVVDAAARLRLPLTGNPHPIPDLHRFSRRCQPYTRNHNAWPLLGPCLLPSSQRRLRPSNAHFASAIDVIFTLHLTFFSAVSILAPPRPGVSKSAEWLSVPAPVGSLDWRRASRGGGFGKAFSRHVLSFGRSHEPHC